MANESLKELWLGISNVIVADAGIVALLGDGANGVIYSETGLPKGMTYPWVRLMLVGETPNSGLSAFGDQSCRLQIDVFGAVHSVHWDLNRRLARLLSVPNYRTQGIACTGFQIRRMVYRGTNVVGPIGVSVNEGHEVVQLAQDWEVTFAES